MRISSVSLYANTLAGIRDQQYAMSRLNQQIATGQRLLAPKDDAVATTRVLALGDGIAMRTQYLSNMQKAELALEHEETILDELRTSLDKARQLVTDNRANMEQGVRDQAAITLAGLYTHIKDLLNSRNTSGEYVFAGFQTGTTPFGHTQTFDPTSPGATLDSPSATYNGDAGLRRIEIDQGRQIQVNDNLNNVIQADGFSATDILQVLDQAAIDLHDAASLPATLQASLDSAAAILQTAVDGLTGLQTAVAGRMLELNDARDSMEAYLLNDRNALSDLTQVDKAAAIIELQQRQISLQAAESAFGLTSKLSLFNYL